MASETKTETKTQPRAESKNGDKPKPKTNTAMNSTWRSWERSKWNMWHWILHITDVSSSHIGRETPIHNKDDPLPYIPNWQLHRLNLFCAAWPMLIHQIAIWCGYTPSPVVACLGYELAYLLNGINIIRIIREMGHQIGFLDGDKHERDGVPDWQEGNVVISLVATAALRPLMGVLLIYEADKGPLTLSAWSLIEIGVYQVTLDFYYYWYHRVLHETDLLWRFHKKHHITKHPNPLLTLYADGEQELFDIILVPLATWATMKFVFGLPMGYYDWWLCNQYVVTTELWGHSGLRVWLTPPSPFSPILSALGGELTIEDHDLHHRQGWKKSRNYGKQTCFWDRLFGTQGERIEATQKNIDWSKKVDCPVLVLR